MKSKLLRRLVDEAREEGGALLAEGALEVGGGQRDAAGGHQPQQHAHDEVQVELEVDPLVAEERLDGQQEEVLLLEAVEQGLVVVAEDVEDDEGQHDLDLGVRLEHREGW